MWVFPVGIQVVLFHREKAIGTPQLSALQLEKDGVDPDRLKEQLVLVEGSGVRPLIDYIASTRLVLVC